MIAHDNMKSELLEWAEFNKQKLEIHNLHATGTTGLLLEQKLGLNIKKYASGPLGGDQQIGGKIAEGLIDMLIFFWDPLEPLPHDPDIKALLRIAAVWNIPVAANRTTADFIISSLLFNNGFKRERPDFNSYKNRFNKN